MFSPRLSLKNELSLALQFSKLDFDQIITLQKYDIPEHILALDARLNDRLSKVEKADTEYEFKVIYTLDSSTKSGAHIQFIKPGSAEGQEIHNILEKRVIADDDYPFRATKVSNEVTRKTGIKFSTNDHTKAIRLYKVRPPSKSSQPENTRKDYCIYHKAHGDYTYNQKWIDFLISQVNNHITLNEIRSVKLNNKNI